MRCDDCGKQIPFHGKVCPYCDAPKGGEKAALAIALIGGIIGIVAGWYAFETYWGVIGGLAVCGLLPAAIVRAANHG